MNTSEYTQYTITQNGQTSIVNVPKDHALVMTQTQTSNWQVSLAIPALVGSGCLLGVCILNKESDWRVTLASAVIGVTSIFVLAKYL